MSPPPRPHRPGARLRLGMVALASLCVVGAPASAAGWPEGTVGPGRISRADLDLRAEMGRQEFRRAGLDRLTSEELVVLEGWLAAREAATPAWTSRPVRELPAIDLNTLRGGTLFAADGTSLGKVEDRFHTFDTILRRSLSKPSLLDVHGPYGDPHSALSPFNPGSERAAYVMRGGKVLAWVSSNPAFAGAIPPGMLVSWLRGLRDF